jgi:Flp pilus assembly protein TadG
MISRRSPVRSSFARRLYRSLPEILSTDERGATGAFVAVGMLMMLGMVALAVDLGMLLGARTDSQRVADAAALAGAASFITAPNDPDRPKQWAMEYAAKNTVQGTAANVLDEDVDVLLDEQKVRVRVRNITERGNAIRTIFARVLGWDEVNVGTVAAAEAYPAKKTSSCPIPLALPDRWVEGDADALFTGSPSPDLYIPFDPNTFVEGATTQVQSFSGPGEFTGYYEENIGDIMEIKTASNKVEEGEEASPCVATESWRCWFQPYATNGAEVPDGSGGNQILWPWIGGCPTGEEMPVGIGDWVYESSAGGNKQSLLHDAPGRPAEEFNFEEVMNFEPNLYWDENRIGGACVVDQNDPSQTCVESGYRVRTMPVIDPTTIEDTGAALRAKVSGLVCVFLEQVSLDYVPGTTLVAPTPKSPGNWNLYIRLIPCGGMEADDGGGTIVKALRLVE